MTDATKLTFKAPIVISMLIGAISMTASVLTVYFGMANKIDNLNAKVDIYIALNKVKKELVNYRITELEKVAEQVKVNTLAIKTIADFIEPKKIEITNKR